MDKDVEKFLQMSWKEREEKMDHNDWLKMVDARLEELGKPDWVNLGGAHFYWEPDDEPDAEYCITFLNCEYEDGHLVDIEMTFTIQQNFEECVTSFEPHEQIFFLSEIWQALYEIEEYMEFKQDKSKYLGYNS